MTWRPQREPDAKPLGTDRVLTDSIGRYVFCGLPLERTVRIEISDEDYSASPAEVTFRQGWVVPEGETPRRGRPTPYRVWTVDVMALAKQ